MDNHLETEIALHVSHLASINALDPSSLTDEIIELRDNLTELIELKKDELLEYKKSLLLEKFDLELNQCDYDIVGTTRSIIFRYQNGSHGRRNIVIYRSVTATDSSALHYLCFFLHPMYRSELPCQTMLDGNECFYEEGCKYSHGSVISAVDMDDAVGLDAALEEGATCLAQIETGGVWQHATLRYIDTDTDSCVVQLQSIGFRGGDGVAHERVMSIDLGRVVRYRDDGNSDNDSAVASDDDGVADAAANTDGDVPVAARSSNDSQLVAHGNPEFGGWERHTRGVGMRLLLQMGYRHGTGLGKELQGRLLPVELPHKQRLQQHQPRDGRHRRGAKAATKPASASPASTTNQKQQLLLNRSDSAKVSLARNEAKLLRLQSQIVTLQRSKERHSSARSLVATADRRIDAMQCEMRRLRQADKLLDKQRDKGAKLKIF